MGGTLGIALQSHGGQGLGGAALHLRQTQPQIQGAEGYLALHGDGQNLVLRLLKDDAHPAAQFQQILLFPGHGLSVTEDFSGFRLQNPVAQQKKGGLSRAVAAKHRHTFAFFNANAQVFHGVGAVGVGVGYVFQPQNRLCHGHSHPFLAKISPSSAST